MDEIINETKEQEQKQHDVVAEIEGYGNQESIVAINRDGDLFFVECPVCHSTDIQSRRILACRSCHEHFMPYYEDGCQTINVDNEFGSVRPNSEGKVCLIELKKNDYFKKVLLGRNDKPEVLAKIKAKYPEMRVLRLPADLQKNGKDAHGHKSYKRYALIPLD